MPTASSKHITASSQQWSFALTFARWNQLMKSSSSPRSRARCSAWNASGYRSISIRQVPMSAQA
jgi:hypothetical protein